MAWNPSPKVSDCRDIARKWGKEQIIILSLDGDGRMEMATFGRTPQLCTVAKKLGDVAFDCIETFISGVANAGAHGQPPAQREVVP